MLLITRRPTLNLKHKIQQTAKILAQPNKNKKSTNIANKKINLNIKEKQQ